MDPIEKLESVLCSPDGKCCIQGSDSDRQIIDEALAALKQMMQAEPVAWVVFDEDGLPTHADIHPQMAQDHINYALQEHDIKEAAKWVARPVFAGPQAVPAETRTLWECRGCGHLYNEKVSSCDCMGNGVNEYNEWVAAPAVKGAV